MDPNASIQSKQRKLAFIVLFALFIFSMLFPMVTDEAYYIDWARRASWPAGGFFDHPPMVSWIASLTRIFHDIHAARICVWALNLSSLFFTWKTARLLLGEKSHLAVLTLSTSFGGIAASTLLTPDTGMIACWNAAIYFALRAIRENPRWWIIAGAVAGFGLWSKYTMILIGPVFIYGMWADHRKQLSCKWPWIGAFVMALVFTPHVYWQSQNNWLTFKFQFGHGFSINQRVESLSNLPNADEPKDINSPEYALVNKLNDVIAQTGAFKDMLKKPRPEKSKLEKQLAYLGDFIGGVLGLWGIFILVFGAELLRKYRNKEVASSFNKNQSGLITASALFPILFFGSIAPFSKIEANWPAMHMSAMSILLIGWLSPSAQRVRAAAFVHLFIAGLLLASIQWPNFIPASRNNRLLVETKGFPELGQFVKKRYSGHPLAVDSYQLKSAIAYFAPEIPVTQWPGITRGSEYTRGAIDDLEVGNLLLKEDMVSIISMTPSPRMIQGYSAQKLEGIRVCPEGQLSLFSVENPQISCERGIREWWITTYTKL
jgi:4-amino-4-deoxy-L-arabinose transferase-like glycosyltransferase